MTGIRTIEDLKDRCTVDEDTGCWEWAGALTATNRPSMWIPAIGRVGSVGTLLSMIKTGSRPPKGKCWVPTCLNTLCVSEAHRKLGTFSELQKVTRPKLTALHKARIAQGRRKASKVTSPEAAEDIRTSEETLAVLSLRHGMSPSMVSKIRRQEAWAPLSPWRHAA